MALATRIRKKQSGKYSATFSVKLRGVRVLYSENSSKYENFVIEQLGRQMDVVHSLHEEPTEHIIELRYLFHPKKPHQLDIYFLVQIFEKTRRSVLEAAESFSRYLINQLMVNNQYHEFELVPEKQQLDYLINPFDFEHIAEIIRREDIIHFDVVRRSFVKRLGFNIPSSAGKDSPEENSHLYYIYPFSLTINNMERLCHTLCLQKNPMLLSVCIKPYRLVESEEAMFEERLAVCEKYSQLSLEEVPLKEIDSAVPYPKNQANHLYQSCCREFSQLLDAAFLKKIQIASTDPIPYEVISLTGTTITEHTGHPKLVFSEKIPSEFIGGYEHYSPANEKEKKIALGNLKNMTFRAWIPSVSEGKIRHWRYLFDTSQTIAGFRLPIPIESTFPGINTWQYQIKAAPSDLPEEGLLIGTHSMFQKNQSVYLKSVDRRNHMYIMGQTGTGKSTLLKHLILQDIQNGSGVGIMDPHGELIEDIINNIPKSRIEDVIYLDPTDTDFQFGINLLEAESEIEKDFCVNYLMEVFDLLYNMKEVGGPVFEMYMRNALQLLLDQPNRSEASVLEVPRVFQDEEFRSKMIENCTNVFVKNFWRKEAERGSRDADLANVAPYITSKLSRFVYNNFIRGILGQKKSTLDFRKIIDSKKIFLIDLRKGYLGEINSAFLGMIIVGKLFTAALGRSQSEKKTSLPDFYLYVDEFQNLATQTFAHILSEARKYRLCLILANQYASQINEQILKGILGNVGTLVSFRIGLVDAEMISGEFGNQISRNDLIGLSNWNAYIRLLIDGARYSPFNIRTILPEIRRDSELVEKIRDFSRKKYGRPRSEVEKEIYADLILN